MKKSVKILIVVLCLIIAGLLTFIVTDKIINREIDTIQTNENKVTNSISNSDSNNDNINATVTDIQSTTSNTLSESEALALIQNTYDGVLTDYYKNYDSIVTKFGGEEEYVTKEINGGVYQAQIDDSYMIVLKAKFTEKGFKEFLNQVYIREENGHYYLEDGVGGDPCYVSHTYSITSITENKIIGELIVKRDDDYEPVQNYDVILVNENGTWLIDSYEYPVHSTSSIVQ